MRIVTYMETYPTKISDVINVKVVKEAETSDLIKMDETEIACILDKNEFVKLKIRIEINSLGCNQ